MPFMTTPRISPLALWVALMLVCFLHVYAAYQRNMEQREFNARLVEILEGVRARGPVSQSQ